MEITCRLSGKTYKGTLKNSVAEMPLTAQVYASCSVKENEAYDIYRTDSGKLYFKAWKTY